MVTAEEKARELIDTYKFSSIYFVGGRETMLLNARNCALICVNEILLISTFQSSQNYWKAVKKEIEKI